METETPSQPASKPAKKRSFLKILFWFSFINGAIILPLAAVIYYALTIYPTLPDSKSLKDVTYQVPLKIVTQDNKLITEIGTKKRIPLDYTEIPERMTQAIVSSEDESFFQHGGVDYKGLARAVYQLVTTGEKKSGGSTITMQVARNFFLTKKKTYLRKLNEIVLSYKIESEISKQEILALYLNKIFLGYRSYGVAAAAQTYYAKNINDLTLDEYAMIAGLPKAPSRFNPVINPERAKIRRNYVLRRMHENHYITEAEMKTAQAVPVHAKLTGARIDIEAGYVAEMARAFALEKFGQDALKNGLTIQTTIRSDLQDAANLALRNGLQDYEKRHGYRGPIDHVPPTFLTNTDQMVKKIEDTETFGNLEAAIVTKANAIAAEVMMKDKSLHYLTLEELEWAEPYIDVNKKGDKPKAVTDILTPGNVIYVYQNDGKWTLAQDPKTESALVSIDPTDGQILALVGGFDYFRSKFNRATQGGRQIGSNIKPMLYSAGLANGMTAATLINDAPVVFHDRALEDVWRPENYSGRFYGPTRLRLALAHSRNLVSIRLLRQIGIQNAINHLTNFGLSRTELNKHKDLSLALGTAEFTPLEVATAYATFANSGHLVTPYLIDKVLDFNGNEIYQSQPVKACKLQCLGEDPMNAARTVAADNIFISTSMMQDVIRYGSGKKAKALDRTDIAGKTGTTNDQKDAWFTGFTPDVVTSVWVGFDKPSTLGRSEVGGRAALPIWIDFMRVALQDKPSAPFLQPAGLVNVAIEKETGQAVPADTRGAFFEIFREAYAPQVPDISEKEEEEMTNELFN